jgi:hypothetical protein
MGRSEEVFRHEACCLEWAYYHKCHGLLRVETEGQIKAIWPSFGLHRNFSAAALSPEGPRKAPFLD